MEIEEYNRLVQASIERQRTASPLPTVAELIERGRPAREAYWARLYGHDEAGLVFIAGSDGRDYTGRHRKLRLVRSALLALDQR